MLVKVAPDEGVVVMALIENIRREDLNPLEQAQGLRRRMISKGKLRVLKSGQQGELAIAFGSLDEFNGLLAKLGASDR